MSAAVPMPADGARDWVALTPAVLPLEQMIAWASTPACGAVVSFLGIVRDHAEGRTDVRSITYEAYEEQVVPRLEAVVAAARQGHPAVDRVAVVHRVGPVALSEASVAVVVSSPHRADAFEAARSCIDTLKVTVPIWKQEHWAGGSDWALDSRPVGPPATSGPAGPTEERRWVS